MIVAELPLVIEVPLAGDVMLMHAPAGVGVAVGMGVDVAVGIGVGVAVGVGDGVPETRLTVIEAEPSREPPPLVHDRTETEWLPKT